MLGASDVDEKYVIHLNELIDVIKNEKIYFGGDPNGLMGHFGRTLINLNADLTGITTEIIKKKKGFFEGLPNEIETSSFDERKEELLRDKDFIICFPGGSGTYEEMFQAISWRQVGLINAKTIFYNVDGFYNHIKAHYQHLHQEGFIREFINEIYFIDTPEELKKFIKG